MHFVESDCDTCKSHTLNPRKDKMDKVDAHSNDWLVMKRKVKVQRICVLVEGRDAECSRDVRTSREECVCVRKVLSQSIGAFAVSAHNNCMTRYIHMASKSPAKCKVHSAAWLTM